ncbi:MAG: response regulator transcription factor [Candidatus Izemoplasmatales bacterium]|nr:response regulator transcription factor [Candidatus Izemoplasmatales bacterium]
MKPLIYSVEDDLNIQNVIKIALENSQFDIVTFSDAKEMFKELDRGIPNLLLLDIMLPGMDGLSIIKTLKANEKYQDIPIMVISAKTSEIDKVIGIDLGADDYLVKPFGVLELVSRVKALLRRSAKQEQKNQTIEINGLVLDKESHEVFYLTKEIVLTKKQFELLEYLMSKPNKTLTREDLLNQVWGFDFVGESRTLDVHIKELRRKMQISGIDKTSIETVRSVGYKFVL